MASQAQILANRENALHSTGPRTPDGKRRSSQNAARHGLCSARPVIAEGRDAEFALLFDRWTKELQPQGVLEESLRDAVVNAAWKLEFIETLEIQLLEAAAEAESDELQNEAKLLLSIGRHHARIERSFYKALREIRAVQGCRPVAVSPPSKSLEQTQSAPQQPGPKHRRIYDPATGKRIVYDDGPQSQPATGAMLNSNQSWTHAATSSEK